MNAELLLPPEADLLREALAAWAEHERPAVPAAERLRRIRARMNAAAEKPLFATAREPKVFRLSWLAASCAAALVAAACAGWLYHTLGQPAVPVVQPEEEKTDRQGVAEAGRTNSENLGEAKRRGEVATFDATVPGLFLSAPNAPGWTPVREGLRMHEGDLLQVAANAQPAEVSAFGRHRIKVEPGSIVQLNRSEIQGKAVPSMKLLYGRAEAWVHGNALELVGQSKTATRLRVLEDGEHASIGMQGEKLGELRYDPRRYAVGEDGAIVRDAAGKDGYQLLDAEALPAVEYALAVDSKAPNDVTIQPGTANLLNVIDADLQGVPVKDAVETFIGLLNVRIKLSPAAEQAAGAKSVTLKVEKLTGAEALSKFCAQAGLTFNIDNGEIVLCLPNEPKTAPAPENLDF